MTAQRRKNLRRLLRPRHVALVGGGDVETVINECRRIAYTGTLWPVNPKRKDIAGIPCFPDIEALPAAPDATFLAVPKQAAIDITARLARRGAGGVVCYTAGFSELGSAGQQAEAELVEAAGDMALLGPNCYGLINYHDRVALWPFAHGGMHPGFGAAIITQSGMLSSDLTMSQRHLPLSYMVSVGNQASLRLEDFIDIFLEEPHVRAIGLHIEAIRDTEKFASAAMRAIEKNIPIVALKTGISDIGARLTASHTGSLSGTDTTYSAFFKRLGICRVATPSEFVELLKFLTIAGVPAGQKIAGFTCSGGGATMLADYAAPLELDFVQPSSHTAAALTQLLPHTATVTNPLDYTTPIWGDYERTLPVFKCLLEDGYDSAVLVQDYPSAGLDESKPNYRADSDSFIRACQTASIPAAICSTLPENLDAETRGHILQAGIAPMQGIETCMQAISAAAHYGKKRTALLANPSQPFSTAPLMDGNFRQLDEASAKTILARAAMSVPSAHQLKMPEARAGTLNHIDLAYPVAAKICSSDISHKTEIGGVRLNITSKRELGTAIADILTHVQRQAPDARLEGILIESMIENSIAELMVSLRRDAQFGLILTIASGGVLTEILQDASTLLVPADDLSVLAALDNLRMARLLGGFRGGPSVSRQAILDQIRALVRLMHARPDIVEIEINPMILGPDYAICADALITVIDEIDLPENTLSRTANSVPHERSN
jgi:acyl-CoA synthetase (NDP forming)